MYFKCSFCIIKPCKNIDLTTFFDIVFRIIPKDFQMKTIAVIKNELFKDYLKIISTDNLEQTLDDPNIPVPFTCLDSAHNDNSDLLAKQLVTFFKQEKLKNKDFFILDENKTAHLLFMLNLIKLSSNQAPQVVNNFTSDEIIAPSFIEEEKKDQEFIEKEKSLDGLENKEEKNIHIEDKIEEPNPSTIINQLDIINDDINLLNNNTYSLEEKEERKENVVEQPMHPMVYNSLKTESTSSHEEFDPFKFNPEEETIENSIVSNPITHHEVAQQPVEEISAVEIIPEFGIPKNSVLHFFRDAKVQAIIVDAQHVQFDGQVLAFTDAAKAAYKKLGAMGLANGLNNWLYNETSLKNLKEQNS